MHSPIMQPLPLTSKSGDTHGRRRGAEHFSFKSKSPAPLLLRDEATRALVRERAADRCEYCQPPATRVLGKGQSTYASRGHSGTPAREVIHEWLVPDSRWMYERFQQSLLFRVRTPGSFLGKVAEASAQGNGNVLNQVGLGFYLRTVRGWGCQGATLCCAWPSGRMAR
jgi:hypothetical protein